VRKLSGWNSELRVVRGSLPPRARTSFAEARQSLKAMQADEGEEAAPPSSRTAASGSQSCVACVRG